MEDILKILGMQRQQAEANLAGLTRQRDKYALQISGIRENIANKTLGAGNLFMLEKWRQNQAVQIGLIGKKVSALEQDIYTSKQNYKTVIAKNLAAQEAAKTQRRKQMLAAEEQETSTNLDTYLLTRRS